MKKQVLLFFLCMTGMAGVSEAALTTIGTAQFNDEGTAYKLIWDDDNNGNSVIWLDYSNDQTNWSAQNAWAAGLALSYNIKPAYTVAWDDAIWRLPTTAVDGPFLFGYDGTTTVGYNITSSEMGHLYYTELGNKGYYATDGTHPQPGWGLNNTGDFENLIATTYYWSGTEKENADYPDEAWDFNMYDGCQFIGVNEKYVDKNGLAVRSGHVTAVPVPGAIYLLGSGLAGFVALGSRRKWNRV